MSPHAGELLLNEVAPRIHALMPTVIPVAAEDRQELAQDASAIAATLLVSTEARSKQVTSGNIAYYALRMIRHGRRSTGQSKTDVMHSGTQMAGRSCLVSLEAPLAEEAPGEEALCLHDVLAAPTEDPAMAAARHLD